MSSFQSKMAGKEMKPVGVTPAVLLVNPKFPHNVGAAIRAASCYGIKQVWFTGNRVSLDPDKGYRLPREERMKGYKDVDLIQHDYPFEQFSNAVPVAVEIKENSEMLQDFIHPDNALYVFGPEDGSLNRSHLTCCHRFVTIPTRHCLNLAAAINVMLFHRLLQRHESGIELIPNKDELLAQDRLRLKEPDPREGTNIVY